MGKTLSFSENHTLCLCTFVRVYTWVDTEAVLQVCASHAGHGVCDGMHVREKLHGT